MTQTTFFIGSRLHTTHDSPRFQPLWAQVLLTYPHKYMAKSLIAQTQAALRLESRKALKHCLWRQLMFCGLYNQS